MNNLIDPQEELQKLLNMEDEELSKIIVPTRFLTQAETQYLKSLPR